MNLQRILIFKKLLDKVEAQGEPLALMSLEVTSTSMELDRSKKCGFP